MAHFKIVRFLSLLFATSLFWPGCRLSQPDQESCQSNTDCLTAFGTGSTCSSNGYCEEYQSDIRCQKSYPEDLLINPDEYKNSIVIGNLMDQSLATHRARENAARLAIQQASVSARDLDIEIGIVFCNIEKNGELDTFDRNEAALHSARYLINQFGTPAIIGPASSGDYLYVARELGDQQTLLISPSATSPEISTLDATPATDESPGLHWRTAPPDSLQGEAIAIDMVTLGAERLETSTNVAVIHSSDSYGNELKNVFTTHFEDFGGDVANFSYSNASEIGAEVAAVALRDFEEVLFVSSQSTEVISFLNAAASQSGFATKRIFLSDSAANADVIENASPQLFPQIRGTRPERRDVNDPIYAAFSSSYSADYDEDVTQFSFTAHAYDAAWLIAAGIQWAYFNEDAVFTSQNIARGLRKISSGPQIELSTSTWTDTLDHFRNVKSVDYIGVSGALDYNPNTEETSGPVETWVIQENQIVPVNVWTPE